jgi:hypothetical protein
VRGDLYKPFIGGVILTKITLDTTVHATRLRNHAVTRLSYSSPLPAKGLQGQARPILAPCHVILLIPMSAIDLSLEIRQKSKANAPCLIYVMLPQIAHILCTMKGLIFFRFFLRHTGFAIW